MILSSLQPTLILKAESPTNAIITNLSENMVWYSQFYDLVASRSPQTLRLDPLTADTTRIKLSSFTGEIWAIADTDGTIISVESWLTLQPVVQENQKPESEFTSTLLDRLLRGCRKRKIYI